jgi:hypothetical protein
MKKLNLNIQLKYLLGLSLLALSANALAIEGKGYRIISESHYSTPGFNSRVVEIPSEKKSLMPKFRYVRAEAMSARGRINEYITQYPRKAPVFMLVMDSGRTQGVLCF